MAEVEGPVRAQVASGRRVDWAIAAFLALSPSLLLIGPILRGEIPRFMDPVMYFYPLRWYAAELLASGQPPWWNRSILCGMPLFSNPQAALGYPFNWPMLLAPGGASYTIPLTAQLGLWSAGTFALARRWGLGRAAAVLAGGLVLAGDYGWSRLQYGNYMNVLPWWPIWLIAGGAYARAAKPAALVAGSSAVAMMILAGAHQLALYGVAGLGVIALAAAVGAGRSERARWLRFISASALIGLALGAPGWLPQWAFLGETIRAGGAEARAVLSGTLASPVEALNALIGAGPADAETAASIGALALVIAGFIPRRRERLFTWLSLWIVVLGGLLYAYRPVAEALMRVVPAMDALHGPRRVLGFIHWALILAAAVSLAEWAELDRSRRAWTWARYLPCFAIAVLIFVLAPPADWIIRALVIGFFVAGAGLEIAATRANARVRVAVAAMVASGALAGAALGTLRSADFSMIRVRDLHGEGGGGAIASRLSLGPGERFFSLDWERSTSYDFTRPDLAEWALPNLAMLHGLEDVGGYEPARSRRYDAWVNGDTSPNGWPGLRQPWRSHFTLFYPPHPIEAERSDAVNRLSIRAALIPKWGMPVYLRRTGPAAWIGLPPAWPIAGKIHVVYLPGDQTEPGFSRVLRVIDTVGGVIDFSADAAGEIRTGRELSDEAGLPNFSAPDSSISDRTSDRFRVWTVELEGDESPERPALAPRLVEVQLALAPGDIPVGVYLASERLAERYEPVAEGQMGTLARWRGDGEWARVVTAQGRAAPGEIVEKAIGANQLNVRVRSDADGTAMLEIHDVHWPGWRATVNGEVVEVLSSGGDGVGPWRWIPIGQGESEIELRYTPPRLYASVVLMLIGLSMVVGLFMAGRRTGKSGEPESAT